MTGVLKLYDNFQSVFDKYGGKSISYARPFYSYLILDVRRRHFFSPATAEVRFLNIYEFFSTALGIRNFRTHFRYISWLALFEMQQRKHFLVQQLEKQIYGFVEERKKKQKQNY